MNTAWTYALRQLFDMQFEPCVYTAPDGVRYVWRGRLARMVCRLLVTVGLNGAAQWVFVHTIEVQR
jgi:hypothetical protein